MATKSKRIHYRTRVLRMDEHETRESPLYDTAQEAFEMMDDSWQVDPFDDGVNNMGVRGATRPSSELARYALEVPRLHVLVYQFRWSGGMVVRKRMVRAGAEIAIGRTGQLPPYEEDCIRLVDNAWVASSRGWIGAATDLDGMLGGVVKLYKPAKWKHMRLHHFRHTYGGTPVCMSCLIQPLPRNKP